MTEVSYRNLENYLTGIKVDPMKNPLSSVYLIYGEELLYKTALERILNILIPFPERSLYYEPIDDSQENIHAIIQRVSTFSLLSNLKVVTLIDSKIFYSRKDTRRLLDKAKELYEATDLEKAAKHVLDLLGVLNLGYDDISSEELNKRLALDLNGFADLSWLTKVVDYCKENKLDIPESYDHTDLLKQAVENGFPKGNYLIITTDMVDKRNSLYQTILNTGTVIDCSVPRGERRADKRLQESVLTEHMEAILSKSNKTIDRFARVALMEMTGFDLRTFSNNLEMLISYIGEREQINIDDVEYLLKRTKKDPIYELTNALTDRNVENSFFFIESLLRDNIHPLQILAAIVNQIRKLLIAKEFIQSFHGRIWQHGLSFERFKNTVMPALQEYENTLTALLSQWDVNVNSKDNKKSQYGQRRKTDLFLAKNQKSVYPIFLVFQKAENYSKSELIAAMKSLHEADLQLKSTAHNPKLVLERAIISICENKSF